MAIVPLFPVVCFVRFVPRVNEVTEDGFTKYALRSAFDTVEGTSHTWSVAAISETVYVVVEDAAIFLSVATGLVEGEGAAVSIVRSSSVDVAVLPKVSTSSI